MTPTISWQVCFIAMYVYKIERAAAAITTTINDGKSAITNNCHEKPYYCDVCEEMTASAKIIR
jgi:hypothetical protein